MCIETKKCGKCLIEKKLTEFNKSSSKKNGVSSLCKICHSEYRREHYLKNKETVLKQVDDWNNKNFTENALYEKYGEIIYLDGFNKKANRVCKTNCVECGKEIARNDKEINSGIDFICGECKHNPIKSFIKKQIRNTKLRAVKKNIVFNLKYDDLLNVYKNINFKCEATKIPFEFNSDEKNIKQPSIDRKDSSKGYTMDNIQIVCLGYNYMKNTFDLNSVNEFLMLLKQ